MPNFYILDVGHGNSSVLIDSQNVTVIDAGLGIKLIEFLEANGVKEIDYLLLSHADRDHIGGTMSLLASEDISVKNVFLNTDSVKDSNIWDDLVYCLDDEHKRGNLHFEPQLTPSLNGKLISEKVAIEVLAPSQYIASKGPGSKDRKERKLTTNSVSAVIRLSYNGRAMALLPGDIDMLGLDNLLEDHPEIPSYITVYPHHGGKPGTGSSKEFANIFCKSVKPEIIVFSIKDNATQYPTKEVVEEIQEILNDVCMFSTRSSDVLLAHIEKIDGKGHKNCVGDMRLNFEQDPLEITFMTAT